LTDITPTPFCWNWANSSVAKTPWFGPNT